MAFQQRWSLDPESHFKKISYGPSKPIIWVGSEENIRSKPPRSPNLRAAQGIQIPMDAKTILPSCIIFAEMPIRRSLIWKPPSQLDCRLGCKHIQIRWIPSMGFLCFGQKAVSRKRQIDWQKGEYEMLQDTVLRIEEDHRKWVAEDPENRGFGPPSPITGATE